MTAHDSRKGIEDARRRIRELDAKIIGLAGERVRLAREVGKGKQAAGGATVDFAQERRVLDEVRQHARKNGFPEAIAEEIAGQLITASVTAQEGDRVLSHASGRGETAVVVGGAGRMGRWFVRFLSDCGYSVHVVDKALKPAENQGGREALASADLVLLAVPPLEVVDLYQQWATAPPSGVVVDVCSVKAPILRALRGLQKAGGRVGSFHPMFGPSTSLLRDTDVVVCHTGDKDAVDTVKRLFAATTARIVEMDLEEHDRRMAEVLTLAHATALSFAASLGPNPAGLHSTTARRLETVAAGVVQESPDVYYEIQVGNPHSDAALARLHAAVSRLRRLVHARDAKGFASLMDDGLRNLEARKETLP